MFAIHFFNKLLICQEIITGSLFQRVLAVCVVSKQILFRGKGRLDTPNLLWV